MMPIFRHLSKPERWEGIRQVNGYDSPFVMGRGPGKENS